MARCSKFSWVWNKASPCNWSSQIRTSKDGWMCFWQRFSKEPNIPCIIQPIYIPHSIYHKDNSSQDLQYMPEYLADIASILWFINYHHATKYEGMQSLHSLFIYTKDNFRCSIMTSWDNVILIFTLVSGAAKINNLYSTWLGHPLEIGVWWSRWTLFKKNNGCQW